MEVKNLVQNTKSWLEARKTIIGGSDVPAIMGVSPFQTPLQLWQDKVRVGPKKEEKNFIFEKGHRLEDVARAKLEFLLNMTLPPMVVKHKDLEYCQVSLDGFNLENKAQVEIKYMGEKAWLALKESGFVPPHYMPQVQWQLIATGFDFSYFCGINDNNEITTTKVFPNNKDIKNILIKTDEFYNNYMLKKVAPPISDMDSIEIEDPAIKEALHRLREITPEINRLDKEKKMLREVIKLKVTHTRMHFDDMKVTNSVSAKGKETLTIKV